MKPTSRIDEHAAGWDIIKDGVWLFSMEFIENDMWYYRFKVIDVHCAEEKVVEVLNSAGRSPIEGLVYENRLSHCIVPDEMFCGGYQNELATMRDFRPPTNWWVRLLGIINGWNLR